MTRVTLRLLLCAGVSVCAHGGIIGFTDSSQFAADTVAWCGQIALSCDGSAYASPQPWTSLSSANTGLVGLANDTSFQVRQQGSIQPGAIWNGDFPDGMGVIWNDGNTQSAISVVFDQLQYGAGAWIQSDFTGSFTATVTLWNASSQPLGSFTTSGNSSYFPGTALFVGGWDPIQEVHSITFSAIGSGPAEPDFAIGSIGFAGSSVTITPEPASMLLIGSALIGLALLRRRRE